MWKGRNCGRNIGEAVFQIFFPPGFDWSTRNWTFSTDTGEHGQHGMVALGRAHSAIGQPTAHGLGRTTCPLVETTSHLIVIRPDRPFRDGCVKLFDAVVDRSWLCYLF